MLCAIDLTVNTSTHPRTFLAHACQLGCPFWKDPAETCLASRQRVSPTPDHRSRYCHSDNHDNCPLFLCRALRSSQIRGRERVPELLAGK